MQRLPDVTMILAEGVRFELTIRQRRAISYAPIVQWCLFTMETMRVDNPDC
jgi:hypothetical protein